MKKLLLMVMLTAFMSSCQRFEESAEKQSPKQEDVKIGVLSFSSGEAFLEALNAQDESLTTRVSPQTRAMSFIKLDKEFIDILEPVQYLNIEQDPILRVDCKPLRDRGLIINNDLSLYEAKGYDTLVPNIKLAKLLNARAEVQVDQTIYKISSRGTYYYPESKQQYFEENYERFELEGGIEVEPKVYSLGNGVYRYNTFELAEAIDYEESNLPDEIDGDTTLDDEDAQHGSDAFAFSTTRSSTSQSVNWDKFPVYNADAKTWAGKVWQSFFGRNKNYTYKLSKKRRIRAKFYYYNYLFYSEIGALGEMQKKNWIGWSGTRADELLVGWHNIILYSDYNVKPNASTYPKNPKPTLINCAYQDIPGFNKKGYVVSILGLDLTSSQLNNMIGWSSKTIYTWLKSKLSNGDKLSLSQMETIIFYTQSKVITLIPDNEICLSNQEKIRKVFADDFHIMIRLDLNHLSTDWKKWVESVVKNTSGLKRPELKYGEVRVACRLGNTWGAVRIRKK